MHKHIEYLKNVSLKPPISILCTILQVKSVLPPPFNCKILILGLKWELNQKSVKVFKLYDSKTHISVRCSIHPFKV